MHVGDEIARGLEHCNGLAGDADREPRRARKIAARRLPSDRQRHVTGRRHGRRARHARSSSATIGRSGGCTPAPASPASNPSSRTSGAWRSNCSIATGGTAPPDSVSAVTVSFSNGAEAASMPSARGSNRRKKPGCHVEVQDRPIVERDVNANRRIRSATEVTAANHHHAFTRPRADPADARPPVRSPPSRSVTPGDFRRQRPALFQKPAWRADRDQVDFVRPGAADVASSDGTASDS